MSLPRVVDQASGTEIASFPIYKVLFCARGREGSVESDCFCFTESYRSSEDFQIHVFSCHIKEAVSSTGRIYTLRLKANSVHPWSSSPCRVHAEVGLDGVAAAVSLAKPNYATISGSVEIKAPAV